MNGNETPQQWLASRLAACTDLATTTALAHPGTLTFLEAGAAWAEAEMAKWEPEGPIPAGPRAPVPNLALIVNHHPTPPAQMPVAA